MTEQGLRILIVDDDKIQLMLVKRIFMNFVKSREFPFETIVDCANSVDEALCIIHSSECYDFVISDINMPEKSGFYLFHALQEMNYPAKIIANSNNPDYRTESIDAGCIDFKDKMSGPRALFELVFCDALV